jgi:hypothetical protein
VDSGRRSYAGAMNLALLAALTAAPVDAEDPLSYTYMF